MLMTSRFARAAAVALVALLSACAANGGVPGGDPDRITQEEIAASGALNAYELVQRARPAWLRRRIDTRAGGRELETLVLVNGSRYGYLTSLRDIPTETIGSMRFMDGSEAQSMLMGSDLEIGAVIQVFSRGATPPR
jgi:hypothetical protein